MTDPGLHLPVTTTPPVVADLDAAGDPVWPPASAPTVAIVGSTATGKSDLAVALALELDGEVVNADAMALYRGMDIGSAKLTPEARRGVPHHQLDVLDVTQTATVEAYQRHARAALCDIADRGCLPLLVGGSGLYVSAVLLPLTFPGTDPSVRARLEAELAAVGAPALHDRLAALDAPAAAAILPANGRRVVRALEVVELTGRPYPARLPAASSPNPPLVIGLDLPRDVLYARIEARVARMFAAGLVQETVGLVGAGLREGVTARRALGYSQVLQLLDRELDEPAAIAATVAATRRFARRQMSWFRRDPATAWLPADAPDLLERALALLAARPRGPVGVAPGGAMGAAPRGSAGGGRPPSVST